MKTDSKMKSAARHRHGERGAALITMLLISLLMLAAGGALILSTSMTAGFSADATAEEQAYVAAEAGLQATLNVLRGNVQPAPTPVANASASDIAEKNKINFRRAVFLRDSSGAVNVPSSNKPSDTSTVARLSRWLNYDNTYTDRVTLTSPYTPLNGMAYSIAVTDPDNSDRVRFSTSGTFVKPASGTGSGAVITALAGGGSQVDYPDATSLNRVRIKYEPRVMTSTTTPLLAHPSINDNLGTFTVTLTGLGADIPNNVIKLRLTVTQQLPWSGSYTVVGTLDGYALTNNLTINWDKSAFKTSGTVFTPAADPLTLPVATTTMTTEIVASEPRRLLVRSTGYGPKGANKELEMVLDNTPFEFTAKAAVAIRSSDVDTTPMQALTLGSSNPHEWNGNDQATPPEAPMPAFAVTNTADYDGGDGFGTKASGNIQGKAEGAIQGDSSNVLGADQLVKIAPNDLDTWLQTADNARLFLATMEAKARAQGRYFTSGTNIGTEASPEFTFHDGDLDLGGGDHGAGLLIVTGNFSTGGSSTFKGIVLVLGAGRVERNGNPDTIGALVVAKFARNANTNFEAPYLTSAGGGNSMIGYDTGWIRKALNTMGSRVVGVIER